MKKVSSILTKLCLWIIYFVYLWGLLGPYSIYNNQKVKQNIFLVVMSFLIIPFLWNLLFCRYNNLKDIVKKNFLIWVYIIFRVVALYTVFSMDWFAVRTVCLEILFFILLSDLLVKNINSIDGIIIFFMIFTLLCNLVTIYLYVYFTPEKLLIYPTLNRIVDANMGSLKSIIIRNTNFLGIITGLSIMLSFWYLRNKKIIFWLYFIISVLFLLFSECRSAEIAVIFCCLEYFFKQVNKKISCRRIASFSLLFALGISIIISGFAFFNSKDDKPIFEYTENERKLESFSTGRYSIWKADTNISVEKMIFGSGSFEKLKENRKKYLEQNMSSSHENSLIINSISYLNSHNGYIGLFAVTGIIGLVLFIMIILQRIHDMDDESSEKWFLPLSYFFIINIFEDYYLRTPIYLFIGLFFMMLFLSMGNKNNRKK